MGFAFSQVQPETTGNVEQMSVPLNHFVEASFEQGKHDSIFANIWRSAELYQEERDTDYPMLTAEQANKDYSAPGLTWDNPVRENVAHYIQDQHVAQQERNFYLNSDSKSYARSAAGLSSSMIASMLNPLDAALMFMPVVGSGKAAVGLGKQLMADGARTAATEARFAFAKGLITREALGNAIPMMPKFAESVVQGFSYAVMMEMVHQQVAENEKTEAGNPLVNIAVGTAFAGGMHATMAALGHIFTRLAPAIHGRFHQR
jgi:hypothetical protein